MKNLVFISTLLMTISSCARKGNESATKIDTNLVIIDSVQQTDNSQTYEPDDRYGYYPIYYIGKITDTIRLGKEKISSYNYGQKQYNDFSSFTRSDSLKMKIVVDTILPLTHTNCYKHLSDESNKEVTDSTRSYRCFAVLVYNLCDSLLSVGSHSELGYAVREARDEEGNWTQIEVPINYFCGTGARDIVIEPSQFVLAKLIRYKGRFKTECRLKYSRHGFIVYSNIFTDYIDKRQITDTLRWRY